MCTPIVEIVEAEGAGKGGEGWFAMSHAVISYDHPHREMTLDSTKALVSALERIIAAAEREEAERDLRAKAA